MPKKPAKAKSTTKPAAPAGLKVENVPIDSVRLDPRNAKRHGERDLAVTGGSLEEFGQVEPLVVWQGIVIGGNGRLEAMRSRGWTTVDIHRVDHLTEPQARKLAIVLNRSSQLSGWNEQVLKETLADLEKIDIDVSGIGFTADEISALVNSAMSGVDPATATGDSTHLSDDVAPDPPKNPKARLGDLWILGNHRLLCGDSTDAGNLARLMDGEKAVLMNTDPPYGISYDVQVNYDASNSNDGGTRKSKYKPIEQDDLTGEDLQNFLEKCIRSAVPHLTAKCAFYLWHPMLTQGTFFAAAAAAAAADILIHRQIIWVKPHFIFGRGDYHWKHELCFYGWVKGNRPPWYGPRNQDTVWNFNIGEKKLHPTQKPVELFAVPMRNHTKPGEICFEPFSGSGSQLLAAEQLERRCFACELDPGYVDVAVQRWEALTGKKAERERASRAA